MSDQLDGEIGLYGMVVGLRSGVIRADLREGMAERDVLLRETRMLIDSEMTREQIASLAATALSAYAQA
jgi:hypothetical protein